MQKKSYIWLSACLIITFLFLSPNLANDFLNWDDPAYVIHNPLIKDLSVQGIKNIFTTKEVVSTYAPVVLLSWSIDYAISGLHPFTFHLINMILHLIVVILVFYLAFILSKRVEVAFITAVLFGIHPMHVETVSWISARKDILYTLFFIGGLIIYYFYTEKSAKYPKWYYFIGCLLVYLLSLLSKGTAVIFPLILFLFDYLKNRKDIKLLVLEKLPFLILSGIFLFVAIDAQASGGAMEDRNFVSFWDSLFVGFYGYLTYLVKSIIPFHLSPYHPYPYNLGENIPWYFYASAIPVLALFMYTVVKVKTYRILAFGITFFFITLIPVIQVLPFGSAVTADRYTYLPYFGLFFILGIGFVSLVEKQANWKKGIKLISLGLLLVLGVITFQYSKVFKNTETLWIHVIDKYPENFLAYMNITNHKISQKKFDEALIYANKAITLKPESYALYYNRGFVNEVMKKNELAIKDYSKSINMYPKYYSAYTNRGILYFKDKQYNRAIQDFDSSIVIEPKNPQGYFNRAMVFQKTAQYEKALQDINSLISLNYNLPKSLLSRGKTLVNLGRKDEALIDFTKAIELNPEYIEAYLNRGNLYIEKGKFNAALKDFGSILKLDSGYVDAYINQGLILMNLARYKEALESFNKSQKLAPNNHLIYYNRGILYQISGNTDAALSDFDECMRIAPGFMPVKKDREKLMNIRRKN
ncbi:tetratricopeptide repeat protein [uncultured Aquimarina sp.]|uniref:tetratricopeptide repeat protein n=1 Tax=uncultured Aquimarina sp. TaxID=575652 RepID=UPI00260B37AC|nr:tetratricopeptide repeat protein [uncultured Aquimarina sp.]